MYFFDIFMEKKKGGWIEKCRYMVLYFAIVAAAFLGAHLNSMGIKVLLIVLLYMIFCTIFYQAAWKQCAFFSVLNYALLFLTDIFSLQVENVLITKDEAYASNLVFLALPAKIAWVCVLFILRKKWKGKNNYCELSRREWQKFCMVPLFTVASVLFMYFCYSGEKKVQLTYLFLSVGLIVMNFLVMRLRKLTFQAARCEKEICYCFSVLAWFCC